MINKPDYGSAYVFHSKPPGGTPMVPKIPIVDSKYQILEYVEQLIDKKRRRLVQVIETDPKCGSVTENQVMGAISSLLTVAEYIREMK